jgi:exonuclease VII small subunit
VKLAEAVELYKKGEQTAQKAEKLLKGFEKEIEIISSKESEIGDE